MNLSLAVTAMLNLSYERGPAKGVMGAGGGLHVARLNFKTSRVGVYKCISLIVGGFSDFFNWRCGVNLRSSPSLEIIDFFYIHLRLPFNEVIRVFQKACTKLKPLLQSPE